MSTPLSLRLGRKLVRQFSERLEKEINAENSNRNGGSLASYGTSVRTRAAVITLIFRVWKLFLDGEIVQQLHVRAPSARTFS